MPRATPLTHSQQIERTILLVRGEKVMCDTHLAALYGVPTRILLQAVQRNRRRFPGDFMFQLTAREWTDLRSQFVISNVEERRGGRRYAPYVFTEHGVAMLSSVLRSERAVQVNIGIMRAFVRIRRIVASNAELAQKLEALEKKYDARFRVVFDVIRSLMAHPSRSSPPIGFRPRRGVEGRGGGSASRSRIRAGART